ncbi:hypothetical protein AKJ09_02239 [Labilithrix luteola]|uniref:Lipoprotein n=1 Tax=Labilithrix luteola TaxID=1391654 RepID=A0A0K1PPV8_9BACT|nr:hypothetical protein [Labilithrix luteola]AKU95575.1 hypothetical protein AKJ09_02239 [Labilithrix luteola]
MGLRIWTLATAMSAVALVVGCTQGMSNGASGDGGDAPGSSPAGARDGGTAPSRLSCMGVLKCAGGCPDEGVDACVQACVDETSESSQPVTTAFIQCIANNQCADTTCIQTRCQSELAACVADDASAVLGTPSSGQSDAGAGAGSMPTELVALWSQVGLSSGMSYEFSADGTTIQAYKNETNYGCDSEIDLSSSGVTTVAGDSLIYHRLQGTLVTKTCGTTKSKAAEPADIAYRYTLGTFDDGQPKLSLFRVNEDGTLSSPVELHR